MWIRLSKHIIIPWENGVSYMTQSWFMDNAALPSCPCMREGAVTLFIVGHLPCLEWLAALRRAEPSGGVCVMLTSWLWLPIEILCLCYHEWRMSWCNSVKTCLCMRCCVLDSVKYVACCIKLPLFFFFFSLFCKGKSVNWYEGWLKWSIQLSSKFHPL